MIGIPLSEILKLPILKNAKIVSGHDNLDRYVRNIAVAEVPDIVSLAKKDTIYLSTLFAFKDETSQQLLIKGLQDKGAAALFVKPKRFFGSTPEALVKASKELNFPLVEIDEEIMWSDLIRAALERILEEESATKIERNLIQAILSGSIESEDETNWKNLLNIDENSTFRICILHAKEEKEIDKSSIEETEKKSQIIRTIFKKYFRHVFVLPFNDQYYILISDKTVNLPNFKESILRELNQKFSTGFYLACSSSFSKLADANQHSKNCFSLLRIAKSSGGLNRFYLEEENELELIFLRISETNEGGQFVENFLKDISGKISKKSIKKLLSTIFEYLNSNLSKAETATKLKVHTNTVKYRIKNFEQMTGLNLNNSRDIFKTYLLLSLLKIRGFF
ncbi:MAG: PucR family transcriptional regulator [Actinobacteria bacterium]|nr:PucR family transcriptional regulator [Actinomycetota bacterium]